MPKGNAGRHLSRAGRDSLDLVNRVRISAIVGAVDTVASNDSASARVRVRATADLSLRKFVDGASPFEGDTLTYVVELQNFGRNSARSVLVADSSDAGLLYASHTTTRGVYNPGTLVWTVDSIAPGETDTLRLRMAVNTGTAGSTLRNRARVIGLSSAVETNGR